MNNTMNFNKKGYCDVNHNTEDVNKKLTDSKWINSQWYNNKYACNNAGYTWYEISHSDNLKLSNTSFVCAHTQFARVNQLGNAIDNSIISQNEYKNKVGILAKQAVEGVNANRFLWKIPKIPKLTSKFNSNPLNYFNDMKSAYKSCVLRIRYNVSTADFQQWPQDAVDIGTPHMVDYRNNSRITHDPNTPLSQNPFVYIGPGDTSTTGQMFVSLRVNTNQYGRTFQDRSYVFSIKPLPTTNIPSDNQLDTPNVNIAAIQNAISNGGQIFNVNVRGKRGNIVQTFPSVEYDFVPDALALTSNDMIHFQWTGSDYNPRRGCNNAEGGPPDSNSFSTDANAAFNSRADRSNVIFMPYEGNNVPRDYLGYDHTNTSIIYTDKQILSKETVLSFAPCYNPLTDSQTTADECYQTIMRIAYLNQQSDVGSLILRANNKCLTESELNKIIAVSGEDTAKNHPLNCAKMNAKPFPYFDGGIMFMRRNGYFPFFSSRNNNFSNRQQSGIICIGSNCTIDSSTGVLQDKNPMFAHGATVIKSKPSISTGTCVDTANTNAGANNNGATSCLFVNNQSLIITANNILTAETFTRQEADNDSTGDGTMKGCGILYFSVTPGTSTIEKQVVLAVILLIVGIFASWLAFYVYNRYRAKRDSEPKFRSSTEWQGNKTFQLFTFNNDYDQGKKIPHMAKEII